MKIRTFPNALVIILCFILFSGVLTYIIPKGKYERRIDSKTNREVVIPGTYKIIDAEPLSVFQIVMSIPKGIVSGAEVVVLIFLVGGCFYVVDKTGALKEGILSLVSKVSGKEEIALIVVGIAFAIGGALEGLQEEIIPMIPVLLVLTKRLGYNAKVMMSISYGAAVIGSTFSPVNPFGAVIAQKVADLPLLSGSVYRLIVFAVAFILWMSMIIRYANKNKIARETDAAVSSGTISNRNITILLLVVIAFSILIYGMVELEWGFNEISALFFVVGFLIGLIGKLGVNGTCLAYVEGFKDMAFAAMIVGLAHSISLVLREGTIIDSIIYGLFTPLQHLPTSLSAIGMMISHAILHITVPSYSGQAVLTIPILVPLSDLIGLSRQTCVLAFQYGGIFMDMIIPTNGALMAIIALAGISFDEWFLFVFKRALVIFGLGILAILIAGMIGF